MKYIRVLYHWLRRCMVLLVAPMDVHNARRNLVSDVVTSDKERELLRNVLLSVHPRDGMYVPFEARHYLSVGLSAMRCIEHALANSQADNPVRSILDFPCGYGRVLRFLKARFPHAKMTVLEIENSALAFCKRTFSVSPVLSDIEFQKLSLPEKFDLIWCGSLLTHLDETATGQLLKFFRDHLERGGTCVFTTHGRHSAESIETNKETYGLTLEARTQILTQLHRKGYGYADYRNHPAYGISIVTRERMNAIASSVGGWDEMFFLEKGWDNHHDVYGFTVKGN